MDAAACHCAAAVVAEQGIKPGLARVCHSRSELVLVGLVLLQAPLLAVFIYA